MRNSQSCRKTQKEWKSVPRKRKKTTKAQWVFPLVLWHTTLSSSVFQLSKNKAQSREAVKLWLSVEPARTKIPRIRQFDGYTKRLCPTLIALIALKGVNGPKVLCCARGFESLSSATNTLSALLFNAHGGDGTTSPPLLTCKQKQNEGKRQRPILLSTPTFRNAKKHINFHGT